MKRQLFVITMLIATLCTSRAQRTIYYDDHSGLSGYRVGAAVQDKRGLLWFATWNGLNAYDGYDFYWIKIKQGDGSSVPNDHIRNMMLSPEGNIWCYGDHEVYEFDVNSYTYRNLPQAVQQRAREQMGTYWHRLTDRQGNVWMGYGKGIYKVCPEHHPARLIGDTKGLHVRTLFSDRDGRLWICTKEDEAIRIYNKSGELLSHIPFDNKVYALHQEPDGYVFAGCKPGCFMRISPISPTEKPTTLHTQLLSNDEVYDIQRDQSGRLWLATFNDGVKCCPNPDAAKPVISQSLGGTNARKILITPKGTIVVATAKGLLAGRIDRRDYGKTRLFTIRRDGNRRSSLANEAVMDIVQDSEGYLYIATESSGIDMIHEDRLFDKTPVFTHFNDDNSSLSSDFCNSLTLLSDTTLMVVGGNMMTLFNPKKDESINYNHIFWGDTCHFAEGRPLVRDNGDIIFGTEGGAYIASAESMYGRGYIPPLLITHIYVNGEDADHAMPQSDTIRLAAHERNVSIKFAALDYSYNALILYRTSIDGSPWTKASRDRELSLYDVKPGTYELRIQSTDRYGRWVDNVKTVTIIVEPHWYETWWAQLLAVLCTVLLIAGVVHNFLYIRRLRRQRREALENYMALIGKTTDNTATDETAKNDNRTVEYRTPENTDENGKNNVSGNIKAEDQWFLDRIRLYIEKNIGNSDANIDEMAAMAATSRSTLNRRLNSIIGITAAQLLIDARMQHAVHLIKQERRAGNNVSIADIAYKCGYTDPKYFSRSFKQKYGMAPSDYPVREATVTI